MGVLVVAWRSGVRWAEDAERQAALVWVSGCDTSTTTQEDTPHGQRRVMQRAKEEHHEKIVAHQ